MKFYIKMPKEPNKSKLPRRLIPVQYMNKRQIDEELNKIRQQFIVIHDLPKMDGLNPMEYMHESLEGLRNRCIELNWRSIELIKATYKNIL